MLRKELTIALLDMYAGAPNEGMRCISEIINQFGEETHIKTTINTFEIRHNLEIPDLSADVFISSGGPGSPQSDGENWDNLYNDWLFALVEFNKTSLIKKPALFICHSFQLACRHLKIGTISKREQTSFGIFPVYQTTDNNPLFNNLHNPFHAFDNRDFQVTPAADLPEQSTILAVEETNDLYSNAIMAIQFNESMWGTQFHPEADSKGMMLYLQRDERKKQIIEIHGEQKWNEMMRVAENPMALNNTRNCIIPNFLKMALEHKYPNV